MSGRRWRRRRWFTSRQAYAPRLWPYVGPMAITVYGASLALDLGWWAAPLGAGVGWTSSWVRWAIWRHRHPEVSPQDWMAAQRRAAMWN